MESSDRLGLEQSVIDQLSVYGVACSPQQARLLIHHLELVIEKNKVVNLTRITDPGEAVSLHVVDSLLPLSCDDVALNRSCKYLDMGTGAGCPGIPLGIMTGAHGLLVDSVNKKVQAVGEFANMGVGLGLMTGIGAPMGSAVGGAVTQAMEGALNVPGASSPTQSTDAHLAAKFCPNCGHQFNDNEKFCPTCGMRRGTA